MSEDFDVYEFCDDEVKGLFNKSLPPADLLDYYNRTANREIFINYDIDDDLVDVAKQIIDWNKRDKDIPIEERKKIKIYINTDGGDTTAMNNFINVVQLSKTPCIAIGMGKCFSAGAMLLISAKERYIFPNTIVMIHKGSSGIISDVNKIIDYSKFLEADNELCKQYILANTNITEAKYKEVENKDWYIFADQCIEYGIASKIITDLDEII